MRRPPPPTRRRLRVGPSPHRPGSLRRGPHSAGVLRRKLPAPPTRRRLRVGPSPHRPGSLRRGPHSAGVLRRKLPAPPGMTFPVTPPAYVGWRRSPAVPIVRGPRRWACGRVAARQSLGSRSGTRWETRCGTRWGKGYDDEMARGGIGAAARFQLLRRTTASRAAGHGPAVRPGAALRGVRSVAGSSHSRTAARRPAAAGLPALPRDGVAAAAVGARGAGAERAASDRVRPERPDRAAGERPAPRGEVPAALPVAPRGAGGRAARSGVGLKADGATLFLTEGAAAADTSYRVVGALSREVCDMTSLDGPEGDGPRRETRRLASRQDRKRCRRCGKRDALAARYTWKRRVNRRRHHDLCFRCRRALRDSERATAPPRR